MENALRENALGSSRILHLAYPGLVLAAALMTWAAAVHGTNDPGLPFPRPPRIAALRPASVALSRAACAKPERSNLPGAGSCSVDGQDLTARNPASF